jgi:5-bromo-4-chloroindolyl phosphate hydrolysis protein
MKDNKNPIREILKAKELTHKELACIEQHNLLELRKRVSQIEERNARFQVRKNNRIFQLLKGGW